MRKFDRSASPAGRFFYALRYIFPAPKAQDASGGPFFSVLPEKNGEKRGAGREIALSRLKSLSFCFAFSRYTVLRPNALRAAVQSVFPIARHAVRVVSFAPVEYLTYGKRKAILFARTATHIARKHTSTQGASETDAEYFDDLAGLSNTHLHRVLQV